jgi:hypothetical protein
MRRANRERGFRYDAHGTATVTFYTDVDILNWSPLRAALEKALHCLAGALKMFASAMA